MERNRRWMMMAVTVMCVLVNGNYGNGRGNSGNETGYTGNGPPYNNGNGSDSNGNGQGNNGNGQDNIGNDNRNGHNNGNGQGNNGNGQGGSGNGQGGSGNGQGGGGNGQGHNRNGQGGSGNGQGGSGNGQDNIGNDNNGNGHNNGNGQGNNGNGQGNNGNGQGGSGNGQDNIGNDNNGNGHNNGNGQGNNGNGHNNGNGQDGNGNGHGSHKAFQEADSSHCAWEDEIYEEDGQIITNWGDEDGQPNRSEEEKDEIKSMEDCMEDIANITKDDPPYHDFMRHSEKMRRFGEKKPINNSQSFSKNNVLLYLYKPDKKFRGARLHASDKVAEAADGADGAEVSGSRVHVDLPAELLEDGEENTIVFCVINSVPQPENWTLLDGRVYGLSVSNKTIQGLQEPINITVPLQSINGTLKPCCAFYNFSNSDFSIDGCVTHWSEGDVQVICSCDHLTYFAILMVVRESESLIKGHEKSLTYITLIGCSISLLLLICTVLLFLIQRQKQKFDVSRLVHVNLAAALILLNGHFLPSSWVASLAAPAGCVYIALALHYSLLATLAWMAVEGFHLYMLMVRVFNIYIRRYLLKLALFAWGVPAVVVLLVYIIDRDAYGLPTASNSTLQVCYVHNEAVKWASVRVPVALLFLCNGAVLLVTVRQLWRMRASGASSGQDRKGAHSIMGWKDACCIMTLSCMLGLTWGIGLLSSLSLTAIYLFCILNSLQGVFISVWFFASRRSQSENTESTTSTHTHT